jgi:hypothetical protein
MSTDTLRPGPFRPFARAKPRAHDKNPTSDPHIVYAGPSVVMVLSDSAGFVAVGGPVLLFVFTGTFRPGLEAAAAGPSFYLFGGIVSRVAGPLAIREPRRDAGHRILAVCLSVSEEP